MRLRILGCLAVLALLSSTACTTLADVKSAQGHGTFERLPLPPDAIFAAAERVLQANGLELVSSDPNAGTILAQRRATWPGDDGENVAIFIRPDMGGSRVEVVARRVTGTQFWNGTSDRDLLRGIRNACGVT